MQTDPVVELVGSHALHSAFIVTTLMWLATAALWGVIRRFGPSLWSLVSRLWARIADSHWAARARRIPVLRAGLSRTLTAWRYLGIHAVVSFVIAFAAISGFISLAEGVRADDELAAFDQALTGSMRVHATPTTLQTFAMLTRLGDHEVLVAVAVVVAAYLLTRGWWLHLAFWALATGGGGLLVRLLKSLFERTRPIHEHTLTDSSGWSFPSGHASGAAFVYGMLAYLIVRHTPAAWHIPIALLAIALIVFVGFSRVVLQVHYFSDVLAGFTVAGAWLGLSIAGFEVLRRRGGRQQLQAEGSEPA